MNPGMVWDPAAPYTAWANVMGGSGDSTPELDRPSGILTHDCPGCVGGTPCSNCGGNVPRSHPAVSAMGWGLQQATHTADPLWKAALVLDAIRRAAPAGPGLEWKAITGMVGRTIATHYALPQGASGLLAFAELPISFRDSLLSPSDTSLDDSGNADDGGGGAGGGGAGGAGGGNGGDGGFGPTLDEVITYPPTDDRVHVCCVDKFEYPVNVHAQNSKWTARVSFDFNAEFSDQLPCRCYCCEFRQVILRKSIWELAQASALATSDELEQEPSLHGEFEPWMDRNCVTGGRILPCSPHNIPPGADFEQGPVFGDRRGEQPDISYSDRNGALDNRNGCFLKGHDAPSIFLQHRSESYQFYWNSLGVIIDKCQQRLKRHNEMLYIASGFASGDGELTDDPTNAWRRTRAWIDS